MADGAVAQEVEERILPGKSLKITPEQRAAGEYDAIGQMIATCPFCFAKVRTDYYKSYYKGQEPCEHFYRVTGGCGVEAAFYFYNPSKGRY